MSEEMQNKEAQKTVIAFIVGLVVGGLLMWVFSGTPSETPSNENQIGDDQSSFEVENDSTSDKEEDDGVDVVEVENDDTENDNSSVMETGEGSVSVDNQTAGKMVKLDSAVFPNDEGWIGVRDYQNEQLGGLLGVVRFSKEQNLIPSSIELQRATEAGKTYAVVFYTENGDREFSLAEDVQVGGVFAEFTAN